MSAADLLDNILYGSIDALSLPDVYIRLREVMESDGASMQDAADVLSMDPSLAARVLRMANSAFYGFRSEVDTVSRAASILGMQKLHDLALAVSVSKAMESWQNEVMDLNTFWRRSVHCGFLARQIAAGAGLRSVESLFVRGLLHDIGHLVLFTRHPEASRQALAFPERGLEGRLKAEEGAVGVNALQLTAELVRLWQLPQSFVDTYRLLLHPEDAEPPLAREIAILNIAVEFLNGADADVPEEDTRSRVRPAIWQIADVRPEVGTVALDAATREMSDAMYRILTQQDALAG